MIFCQGERAPSARFDMTGVRVIHGIPIPSPYPRWEPPVVLEEVDAWRAPAGDGIERYLQEELPAVLAHAPLVFYSVPILGAGYGSEDREEQLRMYARSVLLVGFLGSGY